MKREYKEVDKLMLVEQLYASRLMQSNEDYKLFEEALDILYEENGIDNIEVFIKAFDDETDGFDVMFGMLHGIESYDNFLGSEEWVARVLVAVIHFRDTAKEWEETIFLRMLNSEKHYELLLKQLNKQDSVVQKRVTEILRRSRINAIFC